MAPFPAGDTDCISTRCAMAQGGLQPGRQEELGYRALNLLELMKMIGIC